MLSSWRLYRSGVGRLPPMRPPLRSGGANLEVFKVWRMERMLHSIKSQFGLYIMFPIGWMYYFGTNLENRFAVPDFWPRPEETHKLPYEREEQRELRDRLREMRLEKRRLRGDAVEEPKAPASGIGPQSATFGPGAIERWARGG